MPSTPTVNEEERARVGAAEVLPPVEFKEARGGGADKVVVVGGIGEDEDKREFELPLVLPVKLVVPSFLASKEEEEEDDDDDDSVAVVVVVLAAIALEIAAEVKVEVEEEGGGRQGGYARSN